LYALLQSVCRLGGSLVEEALDSVCCLDAPVPWSGVPACPDLLLASRVLLGSVSCVYVIMYICAGVLHSGYLDLSKSASSCLHFARVSLCVCARACIYVCNYSVGDRSCARIAFKFLPGISHVHMHL
jgi:hypothetical protein